MMMGMLKEAMKGPFFSMRHLLFFFLSLPFWFSTFQGSTSLADQAVVRAVLFYSPSCGHCQYVITEVLPPLFEQYGDQLYMVGVDVSQPSGRALFLAVLEYFNLESAGVPFLVVGDTYLIGSVDIPEKFPDLIKQYLAQGGQDWPAIPGLAEALATPQPTQALTNTPMPVESTPTLTSASPTASSTAIAPTITPTPGLHLSKNPTGSLWERFAHDPQGNTLSVIVLGGMILSLGGAILLFRHTPGKNLGSPWEWAIPILCIMGLGVAGYLAYVEITLVEAVCGPVGDCNTVQQSEYARLFGILPIGILGMVGYVLILSAWTLGRFSKPRTAAIAALAILGMSAFGVLFSIYLTFLEPFVIGATCAWCLTSALTMTALFWLSLSPGKLALNDLMAKEGSPRLKQHMESETHR
jgi:uncharacterized membrane protein